MPFLVLRVQRAIERRQRIEHEAIEEERALIGMELGVRRRQLTPVWNDDVFRDHPRIWVKDPGGTECDSPSDHLEDHERRGRLRSDAREGVGERSPQGDSRVREARR